jgi:hypothetical protein
MKYKRYEDALDSAEAFLRRKRQSVLILKNKRGEFETIAAGAYAYWTTPMRDEYQIMKTVETKWTESVNEEIHMNTSETMEMLIENYWPEDDKQNQAELNDTRRPRLTLRHLNKLRKIQELKKLEMLAHKDFVKTMYGTPPEGEEPEF